MKRFSYLVYWLASLLVLVGCGSQPSAVGVQPTVDPFVALANEQATNQASEQKIELLSSQLTATAEAPIVAITQQAAALIVEQTQVSMNQTATAVSWTPTPTSTPTIVPTATMNIPATGTAESILLEVERNRSTNTAKAMGVYVIGFLVLVSGMMFMITWAKRLSFVPTPIHESGKPHHMLNVIDAVVSDGDRMTNGVAQLTSAYIKSLPAITPDRQDAVTNRAQLVDMKTRTNVKSSAIEKLLKDHGLQNMLPAPTATTEYQQTENDLFPLPAWELMNGWNGEKNLLPFGITSKGLGLIDLDRFSHLATIGKTGEGKSRRFFRPLITCALVAGHRVVIIGKTTDYFVFEGHPNSALVKVSQMTEQHHAERYASYLKALVQEMNRRDDYLTAAHKSTWMHAGRERTFIILDELGNALRLMPSGLAEQARIWVEGLVSEGRKVGFHVAVANQRATGMAGVLSQTGKAIFRVERDEEKAHKSLMGASDLREGYFYARFGDVQLAGAFEPSDAEIQAYLSKHQAQALPQVDWIEGVAKVDGESQLAGSNEAGSLPVVESGRLTVGSQPVDEIAQLTEKARGVWHEGMSRRQLALALGFSQYGGSLALKVDKVLERLVATTTTSQSTPEMPVLEGI